MFKSDVTVTELPLILSRIAPEAMMGTHFYVPSMDLHAHGLIFIKSCIVLSSWIFAYISLKHLPISVVSPMQATRPMWTLIGALLIFGERLNTWQWVGIVLALGSIFVFSFGKKRIQHTAHSEQTGNESSVATVFQDGLSIRQYFCNVVNSIWGLDIWCEPSEAVIGQDLNLDGVVYDEQASEAPQTSPQQQEGSSEK